MSKKAKITVYCPHCGAEQHEPAIARSTYCRTCSEHFDINHAVMVRPTASGGAGVLSQRGPRLVTPSLPAASTAPAVPPPGESAPPSPSPSVADHAGAAPGVEPEPAPFGTSTFPRPTPHAPAAVEGSTGGGFRDRLGLFFGGAPKSQMVRCFECNGGQEVSGAAHSTICKECGAYIDLQDYKISGSFSRNIVTRGTVTLAKGGDLSSSKVVCSAATINGRLRGNLLCSGRVTLRSRGRMPGTLEAGYLLIEKGSEIEFTRPVRVGGMDVFGVISGPLFECDGHITIYRAGSLQGPVRAKGFSVEKDGGFEGELTIRPRQAPVVETVPAGIDGEAAQGVANAPGENPTSEPRRSWEPPTELLGENPLPG